MKPLALRWAFGGFLMLIAVAIALTLNLQRVPTVFVVSADVSRIELCHNDLTPVRWRLPPGTRLTHDDAAIAAGASEIEIEPSTCATLKRSGADSLRLHLEGGAAHVAAALYDETDSLLGQVRGTMDAVIPVAGLATPLLFPFRGSVEVAPYEARNTLIALEAGKVVMMGRTMLGEQRYEAGAVDLDTGDGLVLDHSSTPTYGVVFTGADGSLHVRYSAEALGGRVSRFGTDGYRIGTSVLDRVRNDHVVQGIWAMLCILVPVVWSRFGTPKKSAAALVFPFLLALSAAAAPPAAAQDVFVGGVEHGRGVTRPEPGRCYVITPAHVVADVLSEVEVTGQGGTRASFGEREAVPPDLAMLKSVPGAPNLCRDWPAAANLDSVLAATPTAFLQSVDELGGVRRVPVSLLQVGAQYLSFRPSEAGDRLPKGMSGSRLVTGERTLGMMMSVDTTGHTGQALRWDVLDGIVRTWLEHKFGTVPDLESEARLQGQLREPVERLIGYGGRQMQTEKMQRRREHAWEAKTRLAGFASLNGTAPCEVRDTTLQKGADSARMVVFTCSRRFTGDAGEELSGRLYRSVQAVLDLLRASRFPPPRTNDSAVGDGRYVVESYTLKACDAVEGRPARRSGRLVRLERGRDTENAVQFTVRLAIGVTEEFLQESETCFVSEHRM